MPDVAAEHDHLPLIRTNGGEEQLQKRRLASATRAGQEDELATADYERDIVQSELSSDIGLGDVVLPDGALPASRAAGLPHLGERFRFRAFSTR